MLYVYTSLNQTVVLTLRNVAGIFGFAVYPVHATVLCFHPCGGFNAGGLHSIEEYMIRSVEPFLWIS